MNARLRSCSSHERLPLTTGWELCGTEAALIDDAASPRLQGLPWLPAEVPGTVAAALRAAGRWSLDAADQHFDAQDWWYRLRFAPPPRLAGERLLLCFGGLATLAQVWLNGSRLLSSDNMFVAHTCDVSELLQADNELLLQFQAMDSALRARRARPRWRTPMLEQQQLRWIRTTLLGRTPGWSPPAAPVGPWRGVWLERRRVLEVEQLQLRAQHGAWCRDREFQCALHPAAAGADASHRKVARELRRRELRGGIAV